MKKLLLAAAILTLAACNSEQQEDIQLLDVSKSGHYSADFYVLEGSCYDVEDAAFIVYKGVLYSEFESNVSVTGNAFMGGQFTGAATGENIDITFEGDFTEAGKIVGGEWSSEKCSGYFYGVLSSKLTEQEKYRLEAL